MSTLSKSEYTYEQLESKIAKYLTRKPNQLFNHRFLVNEISADLDLKDPNLLKKLKDDIGIVMRFLKKYDNFDVIEENGSINVVYMTQTDDSKKIYEIIDPPSLDDDPLSKHDDKNIQSGLAVAQFIIDNNLKEFYQQEDYKGNTALHYLMIDGDLSRSKKIIKIDEASLLKKNSEGDTPIDLIKDLRISNSLINDILSDKMILQKKVETIEAKLADIKENDLYYINNFYICILIYISYLIILLFYYCFYTTYIK